MQLRTVKLLVFVNVGVIILLGCHAYTTSDLCLKIDSGGTHNVAAMRLIAEQFWLQVHSPSSHFATATI